jgi:nucleoredoxin
MSTEAAAVVQELTPMEALLGTTLVKNSKSGATASTKTLLKDKDLVGLYFSASWCPPCQAFTPLLVEFYNKAAGAASAKKPKQQQQQGARLEIVYLSSDRAAPDFAAYYGKMPWLAFPFKTDDAAAQSIKENLASRFRVRGIPTLIVLDVKTGLLVSAEARDEIQGNPSPAVLLAKWRGTTPVPVEDAMRVTPISIVQSIVLGILKNPMYIFGTLYIVKYLYRQFLAATAPGGGDALEEDAATNVVTDQQVIPDDEF